jgi:hypothetical protein
MSANRSVQAAQRRRAGPPEVSAPGRGPQPSINSAQMFANQHRTGAGPNIPTGKLAGQQAALAQKNMMAQKYEQSQDQGGLGSISKMTVAQAITLITLRLGKVETQLFNSVSSGGMGMESVGEDNVLVDKNVIQSLISRIDALEKKPASASASGTSNQEVALLKQQFETIKPIVIQSKNTSTSLKQQMDSLKAELNETKELVVALQNLTMDNSNKIMAFNSIFSANGDEVYIDNTGLEENMDFEDQQLEPDSVSTLEDLDQGSFIGTNLKELIEQEFNAEA